MNREEAWEIVQQHTPSDSLRRHMLAVEAAMRWYARHYGQDEEQWAITGLLHDFDYEQHPEQHPYWGVNYLRERGVNEDVLTAILGHATYSGVARESLMAKTLFAVDELTGLITATSLVRPDKSLTNLEAKSVLKRMKDKAFARGVNRDDVRVGAEELGIDLAQHIDNVIAAMRGLEG